MIQVKSSAAGRRPAKLLVIIISTKFRLDKTYTRVSNLDSLNGWLSFVFYVCVVHSIYV